MYVVRKVRNEERYCVKCGCGFKECPYRKCETYLSNKEEAERLRDMLSNMWDIISHNFVYKIKDKDVLYSLDELPQKV
jgi:hypothetical protein